MKKKDLIIDAIKLLVLLFVVFMIAKFVASNSDSSMSDIERIHYAYDNFVRKKNDYVSLINRIKKAEVKGYFHMQDRIDRRDVYHIFDIEDKDITAKVPYYNIHSELNGKYRDLVTDIWYMRGQMLLVGLGEFLLYSELPCDRIRFVDSTKSLEVCVYPDMPKQENYWMCQISNDFYIIDSKLAGSIRAYEKQVERGTIKEDTSLEEMEEDAFNW